MNGAQALIRTLVQAGVDVCFMNPGTSEMHFVAALDDVPEMRGVLALFEGVATGAADGYARIANKPASVLLHLGPGLGNGLANLHNARKGHVPVVNIVGDHATYHKQYDAQLESDIETVARNVSTWIRTSNKTDELAADAAEAVAVAAGPPAQVATHILPADVSWTEGAEPASPHATLTPEAVDADLVARLATILTGDEPAALFVGGRACRADALVQASRITNTTGTKLLAETFPTRVERGAGRVPVERLAYLAEFATMQLDGLKHLILVDSKSPVSFFAYPGKASDLVPEGCTVHTLAGPAGDPLAALTALAEAVGAEAGSETIQPVSLPDLPTGDLSADAVCRTIGALLPEGAIVSDEGNTSGLFAAGHTAGSPAHDWMCLTGGAIGQGLPVALGAAVAAPDRKVIALQADGAAMYTLQSWWTMARENLDVVTVIFNNSSYAVLNMELNRVGATAGGPKAKEMLDIGSPNLDFVALARGMGVSATRATTAEEFNDQFAAAVSQRGPVVIEAVVPSIL
ncbi:MAG: acetolactate synthase large subunit [Acidimicrobiales bacterium]|nr:acetolactate synthase large subunit [Acidimicrobiales bacterium]